MEHFNPPREIWGKLYSHAPVVKDRAANNKIVFACIEMSDAKRTCKTLNASENAYAGGFNGRRK